MSKDVLDYERIFRRGKTDRIHRSLAWLVSIWAASLLFAQSALALDYPNHSVHVIVPFSAGGAPDVVMRILAQSLSEKWQQPVVVENRPGGNTFIGTTAVTRSAADGYTLLFTDKGTFILNPLLYKSMPYSMNELRPITLVATTPHMLVVSNKVPVTSQREFVALAKANPGKLTYGSTGEASIQHLDFEYFEALTGINLIHVPYRGANETAVALLSGEVDSSMNGMATVYPQVLAGKIRALSITTKHRSPLAPDVPTVEEAGVPGFSSDGAFGMLAPAGVDENILSKIAADVADITRTPEFKKSLDDHYFEAPPFGPAEFQKYIDQESVKWRKVITEANIKGD